MARKVSNMEVSSQGVSKQKSANVALSPKYKDQTNRRGFGLDKIVLVLVLLYLLIPLGATFVFSLNDGKTSG
jgi:hypothetical protein